MSQLDAQKLLEQMDQMPIPARVGIYAGIAVLVVVIYFFTLHGGAQNDLERSQAALAKLQGQIAEARAVAANLDKFKADREALERELDAALKQLPNATQLPGLLTDISSLGKKSGLEFRKFKPAEERAREFYAEVPIAIEFYGRFHETGVFLDKISKLSRIVNVTDLNMKISREVPGESPELAVSGTATTFKFLDNPSGGNTTGTKRKKKRGKKKGA